MTAPTLVDTEVPRMENLRVADRCDAGGCPAQAFVRVAVGEGDLDFCAHHFNEHGTALAEAGWAVLIDNRDTINRKPGGSATA